MKYCTNCGSKLYPDSNYCEGCGGKVIKEEPIVKASEKSSVDMQKVILILGVFLVLFASFIFGIFTWEELGPEFRISFFAFETLLFFSISFLLKKIDSKLDKLFFILGLVMIPYTITLVPYYGLISSYIASGTGLYVYLAISYFITAIIYMLIELVFKSKPLKYLSLVALFISYISACLLLSEEIIDLIMLGMIFLTFVHLMSYINTFSEEIKKVLYYFSSFALYIGIGVFGIFLITTDTANIIQSTIILVLFALNSFVNIGVNKDNPFIYVSASFLPVVTILYSYGAFDGYTGVFVSSAILTVFFFISSLLNKKVKLLSLIITYSYMILCILSILMIIVNTYLSYLYYYHIDNSEAFFALFATSCVLLLFNIGNIAINKYNIIKYFLPFNIILSFVFLFLWLQDVNILYVSISLCGVFELLYLTLKSIKSKLSICYIITSIVLLFISLIFSGGGFNVVNIVIVIEAAVLYLMTFAFKEKNYFKIPLYVLLNFSLIWLFYTINVYYSLLTIGGLTILFSLIISNISNINVKPYILYGEIVLLTISFFNKVDYEWYVMLIHFGVLTLGLYSLLKKFNYKAFRIVYLIISLLFLERYICFLIEPVVLSTIVCFLAVGIIITLLYLLDIEDGLGITLVSTAVLFPYYNLFFNELWRINELFILPYIAYTMIITSVIKFKNDNTRFLVTLIPLAVLTYLILSNAYFNMYEHSIESIIFDIVLGFIYIIFGLIRKYNVFIIIGIILIVGSLFLRLFTVLNSVAIVLILIVIGFILIGVSLFSILHKQKNS